MEWFGLNYSWTRNINPFKATHFDTFEEAKEAASEQALIVGYRIYKIKLEEVE